ncbi:MAG TPA: dihydroorotate dehydrogenase [Candidatus Latescibacteria bacterium]|nr:dihydroorotate dehydrogenase [Candidatus Latescibacterota bacterium]
MTGTTLSPDLRTSIGALDLANPVLVASGTFAYGREMTRLYDLSILGGIVSKTITELPRAGNPPPRVCETAGGMLNAIGLPNPGVDVFLREALPELRQAGCPVIVNIAGETTEGYVRLAARVAREEGVAAVELNVSCPNVSHGLDFGTAPSRVEQLVRRVKEECPVPVIAKLSPNVTDVTEIARGVEQGGGDAVSLINTIRGMAIDPRKRKPVLGNVTGGLSGPAVKPVALAMVWKTSRSVRIPVVGIGGIMTGTDVVEFLLAGASAIQIGTGNFVDPWVAPRVISELREFCIQEGIGSVRSLIGDLKA